MSTNDTLLAWLSAHFQKRWEANFAWCNAVGGGLLLPALRGFWPTSSLQYTAADQVVDLSGQRNHLTNNDVAQTNYTDLAPYIELDGQSQYLSRADGGQANWADITGLEPYVNAAVRGLALGGWFYFDEAPGAPEVLMAKWDDGTPLRSYILRRTVAGLAEFAVSNNGVAVSSVTSAGTVLQSNTWYFIAGRFHPSTELKLWVDEATFTAATAVASIWDSGVAFTVGRYADAVSGGYLNGRVSLLWLCAARLHDAAIDSMFYQSAALFLPAL